MATAGKFHRWLGAHKTGSNYYIGKERSVSKLKEFETQTRFNECVHTPFMLFFTYKLAEDLANGSYTDAVFDAVIGVALNGYCVMLQRYNRARVYNTLDRLTEEMDVTKKQD